MSLLSFLIAHTVARTLVRECAKCRHRMMVPKEELRETVPCERCSAPVPPPPTKR